MKTKLIEVAIKSGGIHSLKSLGGNKYQFTIDDSTKARVILHEKKVVIDCLVFEQVTMTETVYSYDRVFIILKEMIDDHERNLKNRRGVC